MEGGTEHPAGQVSIYSERSVPDYLFVFAERLISANAEFIPSGNPIITGIRFRGRANRRYLSTYLNSKHEVWQATLRNSHYQSKAEDLYKIGGVLISKDDLGTLERDQFNPSDPFDYDVFFTIENEEGGSVEEKADRDRDDIRVTVCCIYEDSVILKGGASELAFSETVRFF